MNVEAAEIIDIVRNAGVTADVSELAEDSKFGELGIDSLDLASILLAVETRYDVKIPDERVDEMESVAAIVAYLQAGA